MKIFYTAWGQDPSYQSGALLDLKTYKEKVQGPPSKVPQAWERRFHNGVFLNLLQGNHYLWPFHFRSNLAPV